ncbi:DUF3846 domain-containing protein [Streptomyces sp. NPDC057966]|uniref:DUF3846 domain-containing protein n=1 Tax=Streptomyces sp. NPDC057966 TaxID=3346292 RepID=UPI0036E75DB9
MSIDTAEQHFALLIRPDYTFKILDWPSTSESRDTLKTLYREIECSLVAAVDITSKLTMWVDDEGICKNLPANAPATRLYGLYQPLSQPYYGNAVFTGGTDPEGNTLGLNEDQAITVVLRHLDAIVHMPSSRQKHDD